MKTRDAILFFGSAIALAEKLGITRQAVYQWGLQVPDLWACKLQVITDGKLMAARRSSTRKV